MVTVTTTAKASAVVNRYTIDITSNFTTSSGTYVDVTGFTFSSISIPSGHYFIVLFNASHTVNTSTDYFKLVETSPGAQAWEIVHMIYNQGTVVLDCRHAPTAPDSGGVVTTPAGGKTTFAWKNPSGSTITAMKMQVKTNSSLTIYADYQSSTISAVLLTGANYIGNGTDYKFSLLGKRQIDTIKAVSGRKAWSYYITGQTGRAGSNMISLTDIPDGSTNDPVTINVDAICNQIDYAMTVQNGCFDVFWDWTGYYIEVTG